MDQYEVLNELGSGSFGKVSRIRRKTDNRVLVWKELYYGKMSEKEKRLLVGEVNILRELDHPHIVRYFDRIIDRDRKKIYIVMEHCSNGDLAALIKKCRRERIYLDEETIWRCSMQLICALKECHNRSDGSVLHRDLKPGNVFLDSANNVKLGDFGLARVLSKSSMFAHTNVGTPFYMSPEQVNETPYNQKSDIWSLGCLIYELCALTPPFEAQTQIALAMKIRAGRYTQIPSHYSSDLKKLIASMLQVEQSRRPSVNDLLEFPQISIRIREQKVKDRLELVRDREEKLRREKESLKSLQEEVNRTRELLEMREAQIRKREEELGLTSASAPCGELVGIPRTVSEKVLRTEYEVGGTVAATRRDALADKENMGLQFQAEYPRKTEDKLTAFKSEGGDILERLKAMRPSTAANY